MKPKIYSKPIHAVAAAVYGLGGGHASDDAVQFSAVAPLDSSNAMTVYYSSLEGKRIATVLCLGDVVAIDLWRESDGSLNWAY